MSNDRRPGIPKLTVSQLTSQLQGLISERYPDMWLEGEVSSFKAHSSGHWYFTLKDAEAVISCAMFRNANQRIQAPRDGDRLLLRGGLDIYAPRGSYSFIARQLVQAGAGDLMKRLRELKERLQAEGLFNQALKRPLPKIPRAIGIVTSPTGAAFQDIIRVVYRRYPNMTLYIAPCRVQGDGAAKEIAAAVELLNRHGKADVIILGRGGGSMEDLWCFNEEIVVRAAAYSRIPVVAAVGHETDVTLVDFGADVRAATPSQAAELVTPVKADLEKQVDQQLLRMQTAMRKRLKLLRERLLRMRLLHPRQRIERARMRCDELDDRLQTAMRRLMTAEVRRLRNLEQRITAFHPRPLLEQRRQTQAQLAERLLVAIRYLRERRKQRLAELARGLGALSPLAVLDRGYAIALKDSTPIKDATEVQAGDRLVIRVAKGQFGVKVE